MNEFDDDWILKHAPNSFSAATINLRRALKEFRLAILDLWFFRPVREAMEKWSMKNH